MYYWDGTTWVSTLSADGLYRWNGTAWVKAEPRAYVPAPGQGAAPASRQPTSWTRPLQYAVVGWYAWSAIFSLTTPILLRDVVNQIVNQSIANQQSVDPNTPPGFADMMRNVTTVGVWVGVAILLVIFAVLIIGALRRWIWIFWVILVLLGLSALLLPIDLFDAAVAPRFTSAQTQAFAMPTWYYLVNFIAGLPGATLFGWMLIAVITRGPWAMKRVSY